MIKNPRDVVAPVVMAVGAVLSCFGWPGVAVLMAGVGLYAFEAWLLRDTGHGAEFARLRAEVEAEHKAMRALLARVSNKVGIPG